MNAANYSGLELRGCSGVYKGPLRACASIPRRSSERMPVGTCVDTCSPPRRLKPNFAATGK